MALPFYFHRMNSTESARRYGGNCEQEGQLKNARIRDHYSSGQSIDTVTVSEAIIGWEKKFVRCQLVGEARYTVWYSSIVCSNSPVHPVTPYIPII